jgi:hypothetical protein
MAGWNVKFLDFDESNKWKFNLRLIDEQIKFEKFSKHSRGAFCLPVV